MNILLIDDDFATLKLTQNAIKNAGYNCNAYFDSSKGLDAFYKNQYDLVIVDYQMPKIKGIEILKKVKKAKSDTYVIVISGYINDYIKTVALKEKAYMFLHKPIVPEELTKICSEINSKLAVK